MHTEFQRGSRMTFRMNHQQKGGNDGNALQQKLKDEEQERKNKLQRWQEERKLFKKIAGFSSENRQLKRSCSAQEIKKVIESNDKGTPKKERKNETDEAKIPRKGELSLKETPRKESKSELNQRVTPRKEKIHEASEMRAPRKKSEAQSTDKESPRKEKKVQSNDKVTPRTQKQIEITQRSTPKKERLSEEAEKRTPKRQKVSECKELLIPEVKKALVTASIQKETLSIAQRASIYQLYLKNNNLKTQIHQIDQEKDALFTDFSTRIIPLIQHINSLKQQKTLVEFLETPLPTLDEFESLLQNAKIHFSAVKEAAKTWKIDGQILFNIQEIAQMQPMLSVEHIEKIQKKIEVNGMNAKESLFKNKLALLQAEIKSLSEGISTTKLKLAVSKQK
jgi:hypothetical protein